MLPPPGYQDPLETWSEKFARKFKENPWVPIGCLATCGALLMSAAKLKAGKSTEMNFWLRARVGLQGLTLVALVAGSMAIQKARKEEASLNDEGELAAQKKEKERLEFEERLREAQATTEMEEGLTKKVVKGPAVRTEKREERVLSGQAGPSAPAANATSSAVKQSNSWRWWSKNGEQESNSDSS